MSNEEKRRRMREGGEGREGEGIVSGGSDFMRYSIYEDISRNIRGFQQGYMRTIIGFSVGR